MHVMYERSDSPHPWGESDRSTFFFKLNLMILKKIIINFQNQFPVAKYSIGKIQILFFLIFVFFYDKNY